MQLSRRYEDLVKNTPQNYYGYYDGKGIDYDSRMRFVVHNNVKYWEHGVFELKAGGIRNPKFRKAVESQLQVQFTKASDTAYYLYTPEGVKLAKNQIIGNPCLLWDKEHDMVVNATHYDSVRYSCEASPPIPRESIRVAFRDLRKEKELWPEIQKWLDWAASIKALGGDQPPYRAFAGTKNMEDWVKNPAEPKGFMYACLWHNPEGNIKDIKKHFRKQHQIIREFPWLTTKPKETK